MIKLLDKVMIKEIETKGTVVSIHQQIGKMQYEIRYFYNGKPETVYFWDFELEVIK